MHRRTITELANDLHNKKYSSEELTQEFLSRINSLDKKLNSFITVTGETALQQARRADKQIAQGKANLLTGIPIAHKDLFCTKDIKTSCGSKMLDNFIAPYNATVVERLQQAGMILIGKTNMDEFAMGTSNETSFYGPVHNPWNLQSVPGGSSGGSAAAVAACLVPAATGTDTGGSVRQPAAYCGITGLKPTYGRVSRYGMVAFASSLDQAGLMAHTAEDIALLLNTVAGFDKRDSTSVNKEVPNYSSTLGNPLTSIKIGLPKEYFEEGLNTGIALAIDAAVSELEKLGAKVQEINLPNSKLAVPSYYIIAPAECSSNLARFDGVRYGYRCANPLNINDLYSRSRGEGFGEEVKRRIMIGTYVLSAGYYEAYYIKAQKIRRLISEDFSRAFRDVDIILGPTTPTPAFGIGDKTYDSIKMYLNDIYTSAINLAGLPALSLPVGFIEGLPIGMQLIGNYFAEGQLLNIAYKYQQMTGWHKQIPEEF
ncbi:MAG: glutamyl-tRNA amidotransferase [Coxiella sp. DG_40]|nr:MAG: glutamyl-tRNA amidotransferase [Coxiella sp. DG_40]